MEKNLTFRYDPTGDILYVDVCSPYADQDSEEIGDEIVARLNPTLGRLRIWRFYFSRNAGINPYRYNCRLMLLFDWWDN